MAQPVNNKKIEELYVWPSLLLLNQAHATTFACINCNGVPIACINSENGDIFCSKCGNEIDDASPNKAVQKMINNLKTKCLSLDGNTIADEGNTSTNSNDNECDWTGTIREWHHHRKQCEFLVVQCDKCDIFQCQRKLMSKHIIKCPKTSITCPLLCGSLILRENIEKHFHSDCNEWLLDCSNSDCKLQIKRKDFNGHTQKECDMRLVECEYGQYGCSMKQIRADQLRDHMQQYKSEHMFCKYDFITTQQNKQIAQQSKTIVHLKNDLKAMRKELNHLKFKQKKDTNTIRNKMKKEPLWKNVMWHLEPTTGPVTGENWRCLCFIILPRQTGRYMCKYSFIAFGAKKENWIYYQVSLGSINLMTQNGAYLPNSVNDRFGIPLSGSYVVELNGKENRHQRTVSLHHRGKKDDASGMKDIFIECYQLS